MRGGEESEAVRSQTSRQRQRETSTDIDRHSQREDTTKSVVLCRFCVLAHPKAIPNPPQILRAPLLIISPSHHALPYYTYTLCSLLPTYVLPPTPFTQSADRDTADTLETPNVVDPFKTPPIPNHSITVLRWKSPNHTLLFLLLILLLPPPSSIISRINCQS